MTAASEARRIALMLNDSKWQEIEGEIRKAIEAARGEGLDEGVVYGRHYANPDVNWLLAPRWRDQPDGVR